MDLALFCLFHPHQRQPRRFRAGVDFQHHRLERALPHCSIFETNGKRAESMHQRASASKQQACPARRAGHERLFLFVEHKNHE